MKLGPIDALSTIGSPIQRSFKFAIALAAAQSLRTSGEVLFARQWDAASASAR